MNYKEKLVVVAIITTIIGVGGIILSVVCQNYWLAFTIGGGISFVDSLVGSIWERPY